MGGRSSCEDVVGATFGANKGGWSARGAAPCFGFWFDRRAANSARFADGDLFESTCLVADQLGTLWRSWVSPASRQAFHACVSMTVACKEPDHLGTISNKGLVAESAINLCFLL